jgi:hypothetical protein
MPKGPKGQNRPADVVSNAVHVMRVLTGEADDSPPITGKSAAAQELGRAGGKKRAENMSPERRREIAKAAAARRWGKEIKAE